MFEVTFGKKVSIKDGPDASLTYMGAISPPNMGRRAMTNEKVVTQPGPGVGLSLSLMDALQVVCQPARCHCGGYSSLHGGLALRHSLIDFSAGYSVCFLT